MLEGIPGVSPAMRTFVALVREYHRDFPELNRLTAGQESTDRQILWAASLAITDFNGTPPRTGHSLERLMGENCQFLLLQMTTIYLIESVALLQTRNHINYNNGGLVTGTNDKTAMLMNWLQYFRSNTEQMKQRIKVAMNIESIMSASEYGVHSEYWMISQSYLAF